MYSSFALTSTSSPDPDTEFEIVSTRYAILPEKKTQKKERSGSQIFSPIRVPEPVQIVNAPKRKKHRSRLTIPNMIDEAIYEMSPYGKGLSLIGVKKFLHEKYDVNVKHSARKIREYIKESLQNGHFIQKSGRGANGSYRLAPNIRTSLNRLKGKTQTRLSLKTNENIRKRKSDTVNSSVPTTKKLKRNTVPAKAK